MKVSLKSILLAAAMSLAGIVSGAIADEGSNAFWVRPNEGVQVASNESVVLDPQATPTPAPTSVTPGMMMTQYDDSSEYIATSVGSDFYTATDRGSGIIGGAELVFFRPYDSFDIFTNSPTDFGFKASYRAWLGYQNEEGLGARIRYWEFDQSSAAGGFSTGVDFHTLDAELTQQVDFYSWGFLVSGGLRQADANVSIVDPGGSDSFAFSGVGLTFAAQATRDLNASGSFRFLAGARWSSLFGNSRFTTVPGPGVTFKSNDTLVSILELNLGPQYVRELPNGALLTIFSGVETQTWNNVLGAGFGGGDVGFVGLGTSISILR